MKATAIDRQFANAFFKTETACAVNGKLVLDEAITGMNLRIAFNPSTFKVESIMQMNGGCWTEAFDANGTSFKEAKQKKEIIERWSETASHYAQIWAEGEGEKTFKRLFG